MFWNRFAEVSSPSLLLLYAFFPVSVFVWRRFVSYILSFFGFIFPCSDFVVEVLRWEHSVLFSYLWLYPWKTFWPFFKTYTFEYRNWRTEHEKSIYIYVKWNIFVMQKLHQAHLIVYSFLIFLVCMIVYLFFLGFGMRGYLLCSCCVKCYDCSSSLCTGENYCMQSVCGPEHWLEVRGQAVRMPDCGDTHLYCE